MRGSLLLLFISEAVPRAAAALQLTDFEALEAAEAAEVSAAALPAAFTMRGPQKKRGLHELGRCTGALLLSEIRSYHIPAAAAEAAGLR